jgi:hypothetical protein
MFIGILASVLSSSLFHSLKVETRASFAVSHDLTVIVVASDVYDLFA